MSRFNKEFKSYKFESKIDPLLIQELFEQIEEMSTHKIKTFILMNNMPIGVTNDNGDTLIHKVLENDSLKKSELNRLNMIKYLFNNNVNPDSPNKDNITPLHIASKKQYNEIIKYLLDIGCNPNFQNNFGDTPFHYYLNGNIKLWKPSRVRPLVPIEEKKKDDIEYINNLDELKNEIIKFIEEKNLEDQIKIDNFDPNNIENIDNIKKLINKYVKKNNINRLKEIINTIYRTISENIDDTTNLDFKDFKQNIGNDFLVNFLDQNLINKYVDINIFENLFNNIKEQYKKFLIKKKVTEKLEEIFGEFEFTKLTEIFGKVKLNDNIFSSFLKNEEFQFSINKFVINSSFKKEPELNDENNKIFLIYSNDYTENNLDRTFYEFTLKKEIVNTFLEKNGNLNILNYQNKVPMSNILNNYYYPILKNNNEKLSDEYKKFFKNSSFINKFNINDEIEIHKEKLYNDKNPDMKIFCQNQYCDIEIIIKSNDDFGNNILTDLSNSYSEIGDELLKKNIKFTNFDNFNNDNTFILADSYFKNDKYTTPPNNFVSQIYELLKTHTVTYICEYYYSILNEALIEFIKNTENLENVNQIAEAILNNTEIFTGQTMQQILKEQIAEKLVKNSVDIRNNEIDKLNFKEESIKQILDDYVGLLETTYIIDINSKILKVMSKVNNYFDAITKEIIKNWLVVIENLLKFYINQYRLEKIKKSIGN